MESKRFALFIDYIESVYSQRLIEGASRFFSSKDVEFLVFPCGAPHGKTRNSTSLLLKNLEAPSMSL